MKAKIRVLRLKATVILAACALLIVAGLSVCYAIFRPGTVIEVIPVSRVAMNGFQENESIDGLVCSGAEQSVFVSEDDVVTEVLVTDGQAVTAGTPLLTYDIELIAMKAEMQEINISIFENRIKAKETELSSFKKQYSSVLSGYSPLAAAAAPSFSVPAAGPGFVLLLSETAPHDSPGVPEDSAEPPEDSDPKPITKLEKDSRPYAGTGAESDPFRYFISSVASLSGDFIVFMKAAEKTEPVFVALEMRGDNLFSSEVYCTWLLIFYPDGGFDFEIFLDESLAPNEPYLPIPSAPPTEEEIPTPSAPPTEEETPSPTMPPTARPSVPTPALSAGSNYSSDEIMSMYSDMAYELEDLRFDLRQLRLDHKTSLELVDDGTLYAGIDGVVGGLQDPLSAQTTETPLLTISGGEGCYVEGAMSELDIVALEIGQEVEVFDWFTGRGWAGSVVEIGSLPYAESSLNGGDTKSSYYPFKVYVPDGAELIAGNPVELTPRVRAANGADKIYIERPYILEDSAGGYFAFVRNGEGRLEKRGVIVGRQIYGYYFELLSGLRMEDYIAFPYGKAVREGAMTREADAAI